MRLLAIVMGLTAALTAVPAQAQPVPDTIRSSTLTRAQVDELNRRLVQLQGRFSTLARETDLRTTALRNVAVEIYGADPDLDFETYVALIESGARELRTYITEARVRVDPDPTVAALRQRAIAAAEEGLLTEAREIYDQLITYNRTTRQRQRQAEDFGRQSARNAEDLADATDIAAAARLAYAAADFLDAARRYADAAQLAPQGSRSRWDYRSWQASALSMRGQKFAEPVMLREAVRLFRSEVLPLAPRNAAPSDWASTQVDLGGALTALGELGDETALHEAIAAYNAALEVYTRTAEPANWAMTQNYIGSVYTSLGRRGLRSALEAAIAAHRNALAVYTSSATPQAWAQTQGRLGSALSTLGFRHRDDAMVVEAVAAFRAALGINTRSVAPQEWSGLQLNLGNALYALGENQSDVAHLREAIVAYRASLEEETRSVAPASWATTQNNLGNALKALGRLGDDAALADSILAYDAALEVYTRANAPDYWADIQYSRGLAHRIFVLRGDSSHLPAALGDMQRALLAYEQLDNAGWVRNTRRMIADLEGRSDATN